MELLTLITKINMAPKNKVNFLFSAILTDNRKYR